MTACATWESPTDRPLRRVAPLQTVLEEICGDAGFEPGSEAWAQISICLERFYANGYFTVEGLRQAFVAHVAREISSPGSEG